MQLQQPNRPHHQNNQPRKNVQNSSERLNAKSVETLQMIINITEESLVIHAKPFFDAKCQLKNR